MSFTDIFKSKPDPAPSPAPAPANVDPAAQPTPTPSNKITELKPNVDPLVSPGTEPNGVVPNNPESPLDGYKELWNTDNTKEANKTFTPEPIDPAKLQEFMGKRDLTSTITPETIQAIRAGGDGATEALIKAINAASQQSVVQATVVANQLMNTNISKLETSLAERLPEVLKQYTVTNSLNESDAIYSNPAVQPVMQAAQAQLAHKFPNATPQELTTMTQKYIQAMGQAFNPDTPSTSEVNKEDDWTAFLAEAENNIFG